MGCNQINENPLSENSNKNKFFFQNFEDYTESDIQTYSLYFYQLIWKTRPIVCFFQLKQQEKLNKKEINNLNLILKQKIITAHNNIETLIKDRLLIYYIHCSKGVIITRDYNKINYYLSNYIDNVIDVCFVDISNIYFNGGDKFNLYIVKNQSKYFFNLNMKEINFGERNDLVSLGKQEQIFDEEIITEDEEMKEKNDILKNNTIIVKFNRKKYVNGGLNEEKDLFFQSNINNEKEKEKGKKESKEKDKKDKKEKKDNKDKSDKKKILKNSRKSLKVRGSVKMKNSENEKLISINQNNTKDIFKSDIEVFNKKSPKNDLKNSKLSGKMSKTGKNSLLYINEKSLKKSVPKNKNSKNNKLSQNSIIKKEDEKTAIMEGNISINNNIESSINNINIMSEKMDKNSCNISNKNNVNLSPYEIKDKCLIIKESKFNPEINKDLEQLFFENSYSSNNNDKDCYSPFDHILYFMPERKKKKKLTKTFFQNIKNGKLNSINAGILSNIDGNLNGVKEKKLNDYIIIHNRFKTPFELRTSKNIINKIIFAGCDFSGTESLFYLKEFIEMLTNYKNLIQIKFYQNPNSPIDFAGWKFLRKLFSENFNIRWVSLKNGGLDDKLVEVITSSMILKRIRYLNLRNNKITNKAMYHLNKFLIKNQTLSVLYMSNNPNITIEGIRFITNALQMHPNIIKLDISNMNLGGSGQFLSTLLSENKSLQELYLRNTNLSKSDIAFLASKLVLEESCLITLDIGLNGNLGDEGMKEIGKIINNNRSLKSIGLDALNLTMNNYLPIFEAIYKNRSIESYSLNMNLGLPLKGILNFFLKNPQVKEISITPWDIEKEHDQTFTQEQLYAIEKFHLKAPHVNIKGVTFVETDEIENNEENIENNENINNENNENK